MAKRSNGTAKGIKLPKNPNLSQKEREFRYELDHRLEKLSHEAEKLDSAYVYRRRNYQLEAYVPNWPQMRVHQSRAKIRLFCAGNRIGKSTCGAVETAFHVTKYYPDWYPEEFRFNRPVKCVVSATDFPIVRRVIEPKLFTFLPRGTYKYRRTAQSYLTLIEYQDGSTIDILTSEMKDQSYESADWDFAWMDEPQNHYKFNAIQRGLLDRGGRTLVTFTPLTEPWMKEELVDKADGKNIHTIVGTTRDNLFDVHGNTILSEKNIRDFEDSLPDDLKETRIYGKFFHLKGVIYKEFGEAHQVHDIYPREKKYPVICVLDPHDRKPHHAIWAWIDPDGDIYVDSEMSIHCELPELAKMVLEWEKKQGYSMQKRLIDPNFGRKPSRSGSNLSVMQELARYKCRFGEAQDDKELGHMMVRNYLHYNTKKPVTAVNKPKLFFNIERTPITIRSMQNIQYDEWKGNTKHERDPKETERPKDTDGADCVRYLCISRPRFRRAVGSEQAALSGPVY